MKKKKIGKLKLISVLFIVLFPVSFAVAQNSPVPAPTPPIPPPGQTSPPPLDTSIHLPVNPNGPPPSTITPAPQIFQGEKRDTVFKSIDDQPGLFPTDTTGRPKK